MKIHLGATLFALLKVLNTYKAVLLIERSISFIIWWKFLYFYENS